MTKFAGKDLLLYLGDQDTNATATTYSVIGGQRSTSFSINNEQIDVTDKDDSRWKKLIEGGVRNMSLSCSGILNDTAVHKELLEIATTGQIRFMRIQFADGQTFTGPFLLTSFEGTGEYTDAQQYSLTLESAGDIEYEITT